mmetsp:Transcript_8236/g.14996  ORF Transcript_8236/g.14996 Transcript_8236/m.14996 type:complete len:402 (-) Transcript_8236:110-1315(-)|eukprot:CAMPEP_0182504648 /NCGR_PEP_ID=MMETSP1321-20130603/17602_1 /TAXON_ID=91990 /ORGANISM="Bolidomonas sp., Strain RCC1657" /LENGTH=401 /DNA_ID=CAMNT_0024710043 /DNA_START=131 /DNA_END=1336 /DNA_ORIENTATION=+
MELATRPSSLQATEESIETTRLDNPVPPSTSKLGVSRRSTAAAANGDSVSATVTVTEDEEPPKHILISSFNDTYVILCMLLTLPIPVFGALMAYSDNRKWMVYLNTLLPQILTFGGLAFILNPGHCNSRKWRLAHYAHLIGFFLIHDFSWFYTHTYLRAGAGQTEAKKVLDFFPTLFCIPFLVMFTKIQKMYTELPKEDLHESLTGIVMSAFKILTTQTFLSFEILSCFSESSTSDPSGNSTEKHCRDISHSVLGLGMGIVLLFIRTIIRSSLRKYVQAERVLSWDALANMRIPWMRRIKGLLFLGSTCAGFFLISSLGNDHIENDGNGNQQEGLAQACQNAIMLMMVTVVFIETIEVIILHKKDTRGEFEHSTSSMSREEIDARMSDKTSVNLGNSLGIV